MSEQTPELDELTEAARTPGSSVPVDFTEREADVEKAPDTQSGQSDH